MGYKITRDGETVGLAPTLPEAYHVLHELQSGSVYSAVMFQGWDIICPDGDSIRADFETHYRLERVG